MIRFEYLEPRSVQEASAALKAFPGAASFLAGGTDLLVEIKEHLRPVSCVINLKRITGMDSLRFDAVDGLRFGALTTALAIELDRDVGQHYPGLQQAARDLGSIQVRNRATIAGNICRASPSADSPPPLIADGALLTIGDGVTEREMLLEDFYTGPGKSVLGRGELVLSVHVPPPPPRTGKVDLKHGRRKAMELATVGVGIALSLDAAGRCASVRIALGAVAPTPIRAREAEQVLQGQIINPALIATAACEAAQRCQPISNVRASATYRREMVEVLCRRALTSALALALASPAEPA